MELLEVHVTSLEQRTLESLLGCAIVAAEKHSHEGTDCDYDELRLALDDGRQISAMTSAADDCDSWFFVTERPPIAARFPR